VVPDPADVDEQKANEDAARAEAIALADIADLNEVAAGVQVRRLLRSLEQARSDVANAQRREAGFRKMIDAVVEMFPSTEDLLPEDLDPERSRPRGGEAVRRILAQHDGKYFTAQDITAMLVGNGWGPDSSNPANAVRTAAERLAAAGKIERAKLSNGVYYRVPKIDYDEEPF
jgi:hypothetical protein